MIDVTKRVEKIKEIIKDKEEMKKDNRKDIRKLKIHDENKFRKVLIYSLFKNFKELLPRYYFHFYNDLFFKQMCLNEKVILEEDLIDYVITDINELVSIMEEEEDLDLPTILPIVNVDTETILLLETTEGLLEILYPAFYGVTGYNGVGKSHFMMFLLNNIRCFDKKEKLYIINEDNVITRKLDLNKIDFEIIRVLEFNDALLKYMSKYEVIVIDSFSTFFSSGENSRMDNALKKIYSLTSNKTIFLLNHQLKTLKTEQKKNSSKLVPSIYTSYGAFYANLLDVGIVIEKEKDIMKVTIEKNRFGENNLIYTFIFSEIVEELTRKD